MEDQGEKQVTTIQNQGQIKTIGSNKGVDNESCKGFGELSHERISEIKNLSRKNDLNTLTYYFKNKSNPINFIGFQAPLHLYRDIFNGNIKLAKAEKDQKQFKSDLNEITRGNPNKKSADQIKIIENIFIIQDKKLSIYLMITLKLYFKLCIKQNKEYDLKYQLLSKCFKDYQ